MLEYGRALLLVQFTSNSWKSWSLEMLKAAVRAQVERLLRLNPTRANFRAKFEELIEAYNAGSPQLVQKSVGAKDDQRTKL